MDIRPYESADRDACLAVFDSIGSGERLAFEAFLDGPTGEYFVMEHERAVAGCGGYAISGDGVAASLVWGMVRRDLQRMGLGRFLLLYRIREIGKAGNVELVVVQTPRQSAPFFEKQGFRMNASGLDRVEMIKRLTVCASKV